MPHGRGTFYNQFFGHAVGLVFTLALNVLHHAPLRIEPGLINGPQQMTHPVGFNPLGDVQGILRNVFKKIRAVVARRAVQIRGANAFHGFKERALIATAFEMVAPREHEMLEQVRKTGFARLFVFGPDMIPEVDRDNRRLVVLVYDQREPIGQHEFFEGNFDRGISDRPAG